MNNLKVNCYSGQTYAERPKSFLWEDTEYEVEEIAKLRGEFSPAI